MAPKRGKGRGRGTSDGGNDGREKLTPLQEVLLKEAAREVTIVSDGLSQKVRMDEVVTRKLMQMAAKGGQHSISNAVYQINVAQRLNQQNIDDKVAFGHKYKAYQRHLLETALKHGADIDSALPHPDDIVVEEGIGYKVIGPIDDIELQAVRKDCDTRDAAILQAALEERLGPAGDGDQEGSPEESWNASPLLMVSIFNDNLPMRFQKSDIQIAMELMRYHAVSKRELLKRAHRKWTSLGRPKPRGWRMPPIQTVVAALERMMPVMMTVYPEVESGRLTSVPAIAARLQTVLNQQEAGLPR